MPESIFAMSPYIREAGIQGSDDWATTSRRIYDYEFFYCFRGTGNITIGDSHYTISPGALFVVPPDTPHLYSLSSTQPCDCYWFHCDLFSREDRDWPYRYYNNPSDYIKLFGSRLLYPEHIRDKADFEGDYQIPEFLVIEERDTVEHHFDIIYHAFLSGSSLRQITAIASFYAILATVFRQQSSETRQSTKAKNQVNLMRNYIRQNYFRKIKVSDIAEVTVYNTDYAAKLFKQVMGESVNDYLVEFRINKAKRLLLELDLTISDVAEMCGFNDESYFSSVVKAREGLSPSQLRDSIMSTVKEI